MLLPFLAACGGGGSMQSSLPQQIASSSPDGLGDTERTVEPAGAERQLEYVSSSADLLYVGNPGNNSITVYPHGATGNAAPVAIIAGWRTGIDHPGQLAEDAQGNLYVANGAYALGMSAKPAILVFAHGANGNVYPIRVLAGPLTGIHNVGAMTVDQTTGKIFVDDYRFQTQGFLVDVSLLRFPPNATGNTPPYARSTPGLFPARQLTSDSTGKNVIEAHAQNEPSNFGLGIDTLFKQFANNTSAVPAPGFPIDSLDAAGIVDDPTTKTYLTTSPGGIYRFAETTSGNGTVEGHPATFKPATVAVISSDTCGTQLALGYLRNIYVTHSKQFGCSSDAMYVYAPYASGNVPPIRVLTGGATGLSRPYGIFEGR